MSNQDELSAGGREISPPGVLVPAVRCALEMTLVGLIITLLGLPTSSALHLGIVLIVAVVSMAVVLFWCLNRQMAEWVRRATGKPTLTDGSDSGLL